MDPIYVIANPNAGGGKGVRVLPRLEQALEDAGLPFVIQATEAPGHASRIAAHVRDDGARRILVVGGDGTIHEVVSGLLRGDAGESSLEAPRLPALGILPVGTGNDFQRMIRSPGGVESAARLMRDGVPRDFDVGFARWDAGEGHFVNLAGVGIDVEVLRRRPAFSRLPGVLQYLGALCSALIHFRPASLRVEYEQGTHDAGRVEGACLMAAVTVGPSIGGGFLVSPRARPDDGLLDLFVVERLGLVKIALYLPGILRGSLAGKREIHQAQVTRVRLSPTDGPTLTFQLDGELIPAVTTSLDVRVLPRRLSILELPEEAS